MEKRRANFFPPHDVQRWLVRPIRLTYLLEHVQLGLDLMFPTGTGLTGVNHLAV